MTLDSTMLLYTYISRFPVNPHYQQTRKIRQSCRHKFYPQLFLVTFSTSPTNGHVRFHRRKRVYSALLKGSHTRAYTAKHGPSGRGVVSLPSTRTARSRTSPGRVSKRRTLPLWDLGREVLSKDTESLRDSDVLMHVAVPRRRGPAGLRDPVVRPLMLRFSVSVRKVSAQSPVNATHSSSHLNPSTTQPSSKHRTQRPTRRNVCALDVAILEVSCYTDSHRTPLKNFFIFFENRVRNGAARASI